LAVVKQCANNLFHIIIILFITKETDCKICGKRVKIVVRDCVDRSVMMALNPDHDQERAVEIAVVVLVHPTLSRILSKLLWLSQSAESIFSFVLLAPARFA
jgi:hypothetical protein